jgi:hypothetical protein
MMRQTVRAVRALALALLCAFAVTACAPLLPGEPNGPFNGDWRLVQAGWGSSRFTVVGTGITLVSNGDSVVGFSGCREYAFELSGNAEEWSLGDPLNAEPGFPPPADLAPCSGALERIESRYLGALLSADSAEVRHRELKLTDGTSFLIFTAIRPFPGPQLAGTTWELERYGDTWRLRWETDIVGTPTVRFVGEDRIVGTLGCGGFAGTYRVVRTEVFLLSFQRFGAEGCLSAFLEQDQLLAQFLGGFRATVSGDHLVLSHKRLQLVYRAVPVTT